MHSSILVWEAVFRCFTARIFVGRVLRSIDRTLATRADLLVEYVKSLHTVQIRHIPVTRYCSDIFVIVFLACVIILRLISACVIAINLSL